MKKLLICLAVTISATSFAATITTGKEAEASFNALENQFEYRYAGITTVLSIETTVRHDADETITCEKEIVKYSNVVDSVSYKCLSNK